MVQPIDLHLHLGPDSFPHVDYPAEVGQPRPELTEEHSGLPNLQDLFPVRDLGIKEISVIAYELLQISV